MYAIVRDLDDIELGPIRQRREEAVPLLICIETDFNDNQLLKNIKKGIENFSTKKEISVLPENQSNDFDVFLDAKARRLDKNGFNLPAVYVTLSTQTTYNQVLTALGRHVHVLFIKTVEGDDVLEKKLKGTDNIDNEELAQIRTIYETDPHLLKFCNLADFENELFKLYKNALRFKLLFSIENDDELLPVNRESIGNVCTQQGILASNQSHDLDGFFRMKNRLRNIDDYEIPAIFIATGTPDTIGRVLSALENDCFVLLITREGGDDQVNHVINVAIRAQPIDPGIAAEVFIRLDEIKQLYKKKPYLLKHCDATNFETEFLRLYESTLRLHKPIETTYRVRDAKSDVALLARKFYDIDNGPNFIITINGTAIGLCGEFIEQFSRDIANIASKTSAWILTECERDNPLRQLIDAAIYESNDPEYVPFITFLQRNRLNSIPANNDESKAVNKSYYIGPNDHCVKTRDVFVNFERGLRHYEGRPSSAPVPSVLVVMQGDANNNTADMILSAFENDVSVILITGTKGYIDSIDEELKKVDEEMKEKSPIVVRSETECDNNDAEDANMDSLTLGNSKLERIKKEYAKKPHLLTRCHYTESIENAFISALLTPYENVSWRIRCKNVKNLECAIKINGNALVGDEDDPAKEFTILSNIISSHDQQELEGVVETALLCNSHMFIKAILNRDWLRDKLFLSQQNAMEAFNWEAFLTLKRLYFLYNSDEILERRRCQYIGFMFLPKEVLTFDVLMKFLEHHTFFGFDIDILPNDSRAIRDKTIKDAKENYRKGIPNDFVVDLDAQEQPNDDDLNVDVNLLFVKNPKVLHTMHNLFLWAVLFQQYEMADYFWVKAEDQMSLALFASKLLKSVAKQLDPELKEKTEMQSEKFERLAMGLMDQFDRNTTSFMNSIILLNTNSFSSEIDNLQMAVECGCKNFIAQGCVQDFLNDIWYGGVQQSPKRKGFLNWVLFTGWDFIKVLLCIISLTIAIPCLMMEKKETKELNKRDHKIIKRLKAIKTGKYKNYFRGFEINKGEEEDDENAVEKYFEKFLSWRWTRFFRAPVTRYYLSMLSSVCFLVLFTFMLVNTFSKVKLGTDGKSMNTSEIGLDRSVNKTMIVHYKDDTTYCVVAVLLHIWVGILAFSECVQCLRLRKFVASLKYENSSELCNFKQCLVRYFNDEWNWVDFFGIVFYVLGLSLRENSVYIEDDKFVWARIFMSVDLIIWLIRFTHFFLASQNLGPKLVMLRKMLGDIYFFLATLVIFLLSFGIFMQANLQPNIGFPLSLISQVTHKAFWPVFGELGILESNSSGLKCADESEECEMSDGAIASYILLMIYMIVANILLINLLIALFNSTYKKVEDNYDAVWKFHRFKLTLEYVDYPVFPLPFSFIDHLFGFLIKPIYYLIQKKWFKRVFNNPCSFSPKDPEEPEDGLAILERKFAYDCLKKMKREDKEREKECANKKKKNK